VSDDCGAGGGEETGGEETGGEETGGEETGGEETGGEDDEDPAVGDSCEISTGSDGMLDCSLKCWDSLIPDLTDDSCDRGSFIPLITLVDLDCAYFEYDNGMCLDDDSDGYRADVDCDDGDSYLTPADGDSDGYSTCDGDCDDDDEGTYPGAPESIWDDIDSDCDGSVIDYDIGSGVDGLVCSDECSYASDGDCDDGGPDSDFTLCALGTDCSDCGARVDADGDGYDAEEDCDDYDNSMNFEDLDGDGWTTCEGDCDDYDNSMNFEDLDGDGWTTCGGDCDDEDTSFHPFAGEVFDCGGWFDSCTWDDIDHNCDGHPHVSWESYTWLASDGECPTWFEECRDPSAPWPDPS